MDLAWGWFVNFKQGADGTHGMVRVTVFLHEGACAHDHKKGAEKHGINVVEAERLLGYDDPQVWLSFPPPDLTPDVVNGHGQKLGRQGQIFKRLPHRCKWIQIVHTDPKELSKYKIDSRAVCKGEENIRLKLDSVKWLIWSLLLDPNCMMLSLNTLEMNMSRIS